MLMDLHGLIVKWNLKIDGVLHVGAHLAEEARQYHQLGCEPVWWVEANPAVFAKILGALRGMKQYLVPGLVYSEPDVQLGFNVTNYDGMSSSIFEFGTHTEFSPDTVFVNRISIPTTTIDDIVEREHVQANFLNMDLQGAELHAVQGAEKFLAGVDAIICEVNNRDVYKGCAKVWELDEFLGTRGFDRVETSWVGGETKGQGWGDALFVRRRA